VTGGKGEGGCWMGINHILHKLPVCFEGGRAKSWEAKKSASFFPL